MLLNFALWFICFGLSFLAESLGLATQGTAFLFIKLGLTAIVIAFLILIFLFGGDGLGERIGIPVALAGLLAIGIAIVLFATWGATKLFHVDYYVAFQIMTFGQCLCSSSSKKD